MSQIHVHYKKTKTKINDSCIFIARDTETKQNLSEADFPEGKIRQKLRRSSNICMGSIGICKICTLPFT